MTLPDVAWQDRIGRLFRTLVAVTLLLGSGCLPTRSSQTTQPIGGDWVAFSSEERQIMFTFTVEGEGLSGTVREGDGDQVTISQGVVDGDEFSFVTAQTNRLVRWSGVYSKGQLHITRTRQDEGKETEEKFTAERQHKA